MYSPAIQPLSPTAYQAALQRLKRSIQLSQGQFTIILVQNTSPLVRRWVLDSLRQSTHLPIKELVLHPTITDIFSTIKRAIDRPTAPQTLSIVGLHNLEHLETALARLNLARDRFQQELNCPMIWWIDEKVSRTLRRTAPDFTNCLTAPIQLDTAGTALFRMEPTPKLRHALNAPMAIAPKADSVTYSQPQHPTEIPQLINILQQEQTLIVNLDLLREAEARHSLAQLITAVQTLGGHVQKIGQQIYLFRLAPKMTPATVSH